MTFTRPGRFPEVQPDRKVLTRPGELIRCHDRLPAAATASVLFGQNVGAGSFPDQIALKLCEYPEQVED